jgi:hypothetical protein
MTVSHATRIAEEDQPVLFVCYFVFVVPLKEKAEVPLSSSGMVLKVVLGTPEARYCRIRWLIDTKRSRQQYFRQWWAKSIILFKALIDFLGKSKRFVGI